MLQQFIIIRYSNVLNDENEAESLLYLNMPKILQAIKCSCADSVHPGYGFLSDVLINVNSICLVRKLNQKFFLKVGLLSIPGFDGQIENSKHALAFSSSN